MKFESKFIKTRSGLEIELRSARTDEAQLMIDYLKRTCAETPFLLSEPEDVNYTVEGEIAFLQNCENSDNSLMLCAYVNGEFVGNGSFSPVNAAKRLCHRASLGVAIYADYCNLGIGEILVKTLLDKAKECGYEIMELDVFSTNERGIHLYKKLGFIERGLLKNAVKYKDGTYCDLILMQKEL